MSGLAQPFVAVDWGTSSLRAAHIAPDGTVLAERSAPRGILSVTPDEFAPLLIATCADWAGAEGTFYLISGMAGSRQGWVEAPYCPCPASFDDLGARLAWVEAGRIAIVPGLSDMQRDVPDVMRGEELQVFGAMQLAGRQDGLFVLPGTHSKWATVQAGRITAFRTFMTGEVYGLLARHSILARTIDADAPFDEPAFTRGVAVAQNGAGLLHHAFGVRTLALFDQLGPGPLSSYLSGLVIGDELRSQPLASAKDVVLVGAPALTARYAIALASHRVTSRAFGAEATWAGAHALALHLHRQGLLA